MVGQVEVGVVHPDRVGDVAGHAAQPLAVPGHERDALTDQREQAVVVEAVVRRLEDLDGAAVRGRLGSLGSKKGHIGRAEPLGHAVSLVSPSATIPRQGGRRGPGRTAR